MHEVWVPGGKQGLVCKAEHECACSIPASPRGLRPSDHGGPQPWVESEPWPTGQPGEDWGPRAAGAPCRLEQVRAGSAVAVLSPAFTPAWAPVLSL